MRTITELILELSNVSKYYDKKKVLDNISLKIKKGSVNVILGPSGCGKSTLLRCLNGLEPIQEGNIVFSGINLNDKKIKWEKIRQRIGMVFQSYDLFPNMTVIENILLGPLKVQKRDKSEVLAQAEELLEKVGLADRKNSYPKELSGGQKQRVGIARALASDPKVLLCDEATSALDPQTTKSILDLLKDINKRLNLTIVMITHQMEVVKEVCDRVAVIENGEIIEEGSMIDVFTDPQKPTTKDFVKSINNVELPALLQSSSISAVYTEGSKLIVRLSFIGNSAGDPIVSGMVKKFDVDINIIYGNIDSLKDIPFGTLVIEISGSAAGIKNALQYLHEQQLKVEVIGYVS